MKVLFLQLWYDLYGGIETVNDTLAGQFKKDGLDVSILCLWEKGQNEYIQTHDYAKIVIDKEPIRASYKQMIKDLLHFKFKKILKDIKKSMNYYRVKKENKKAFSNKVKEINPDFIIVSSPELITLVPELYLNNTVIHMHTGMQFYEQNKKLTKLVLKYNNRINRIIWLTPNFEKESKKLGFTKGTYMSNPVRIKSDSQNTLENRTITFIGRICDVKRVDVLAEIFNQADLASQGWKLKIYGTGDSSKIPQYENVMLMGGTDNVKEALADSSVFALTSAYEGFPMSVLEAYECGIPVIIFDYGISSSELVIDGETGYIIPADDMDLYVSKLKFLCENTASRICMGKNAKEFVKKYYPENVAQRWYKLFRGEL